MADFLQLPDDIVRNILVRLPAKPLLRCRCVSKYWNRLITDPYFMKLRSRRTIILRLNETCLHIDHNDVPISILNRRYPLENLRPILKVSRVIRTFNGIVLLACVDTLILYNPLTGASKTLPQAPVTLVHHQEYNVHQAYGFGYGANPDDLKIVMFRRLTDICDVYSFKDSSWSSWSKLKFNMRSPHAGVVGTFFNGFLYWVVYDRNALIVLDVKDMLLSEIDLPFSTRYCTILGTVDGCLCSLNRSITAAEYDMWVMKEHGVWSIKCSFSLSLNTYYFPLHILDGGRILMVTNRSRQLAPEIYDTSNDSYVTFNMKLCAYCPFGQMQGLEYVESLLSPSDMCSSSTSELDVPKKEYIMPKLVNILTSFFAGLASLLLSLKKIR